MLYFCKNKNIRYNVGVHAEEEQSKQFIGLLLELETKVKRRFAKITEKDPSIVSYVQCQQVLSTKRRPKLVGSFFVIPNLRMDLRFKLLLPSGCLYDSAVERHDHFSNLLPIKLEIEDTLGRGLARGRPSARGGPYTEILKVSPKCFINKSTSYRK